MMRTLTPAVCISALMLLWFYVVVEFFNALDAAAVHSQQLSTVARCENLMSGHKFACTDAGRN